MRGEDFRPVAAHELTPESYRWGRREFNRDGVLKGSGNLMNERRSANAEGLIVLHRMYRRRDLIRNKRDEKNDI